MPRVTRVRLPSPAGGWPSSADHDAQVLRSPAGQARQQPGHAALVAAAANIMQQVVAIDEQQLQLIDAAAAVHRLRGSAATIRTCSFSSISTVSCTGEPKPIPGMPELLTQREADGDIIVYVTNNSRWHRSEYRDRLLGMGAPASPERDPDVGPRDGAGLGSPAALRHA